MVSRSRTIAGTWNVRLRTQEHSKCVANPWLRSFLLLSSSCFPVARTNYCCYKNQQLTLAQHFQTRSTPAALGMSCNRNLRSKRIRRFVIRELFCTNICTMPENLTLLGLCLETRWGRTIWRGRQNRSGAVRKAKEHGKGHTSQAVQKLSPTRKFGT